jgi:rare lipoprotein A
MQKKHHALFVRLALALLLFVSVAPPSAFARQSGTKAQTPSLKNKLSQVTRNGNHTKTKELSSTQPLPNGDKVMVAVGKASFYANGFRGNKTANGEQFDKKDFTAAHRSLPFGTIVRVTNLNNGKMVFVKINDRGPFIKNRIIDLSKAAAKQLGLVDSGIGKVKIEAYN